MADVTSLDEREADNWHYRGEGAANVVLTYHGSEPALVGKVLRLQKLVRGADKISPGVKRTPVLSREEQILWADWPDMVAATSSAELNHAYIRDVLRPKLGETHVDPGTIVSLSGLFVEALNRNIAHRRPAWRVDSGSLNAASGIGLLIADHSNFSEPRDTLTEVPPTITVEIKPKWGFLPDSPWIKEENAIKKTVSRFKMHQTLKLLEGKTKEISKYCPLDLFSGTESGIQKALSDLFVTPQNNLRIFCNGEEIFGDFDGSTTTPEDARVLLENVLKGILLFQEGLVPAFQKLMAHLLFRSNILEELLAVQKLDTIDIEGSIQAYEKFQKHLDSSAFPVESQEGLLNGSATNATESPSQETNCVDGPSPAYESGKHSKLPFQFEDCRRILRDYLISTTAKDCGIMLALQPLEPVMQADIPLPGTGIVKHSGRYYLYKVNFLDLDVKPLKKLPRYLQLDQEIVNAYRSMYVACSIFTRANLRSFAPWKERVGPRSNDSKSHS